MFLPVSLLKYICVHSMLPRRKFKPWEYEVGFCRVDAMREVYNRSGRTAATAAGGFPSGGSSGGQRGGYSHSGSYAGRGSGGRNTYTGQGYAGFGQGAQYQARAPRRSARPSRKST